MVVAILAADRIAQKMQNGHTDRGFRLPNVLIGVVPPKAPVKAVAPKKSKPEPMPLPPIKGEITLPGEMTVRELAAALGQKPFRIMADVMELKVMVTVNHQLDFDTIAKVARMHGLIAKRAV